MLVPIAGRERCHANSSPRRQTDMTLRRLAIIGAGGIAEVAISTLGGRLSSPLEHVSVLVPSSLATQAWKLLDRAGSSLAMLRSVRTDIDALLADKPNVVAECASHEAVREYGSSILSAGIDFVIISIGALADDHLRTSLQDAATAGHSRIVLPSGAIGGVDALVAARLSGLESVTYTGRKPPNVKTDRKITPIGSGVTPPSN